MLVSGSLNSRTTAHVPLSGDMGGAVFCFHANIFNGYLILVFTLNFALFY